jgi:hypothetical protein
MLFNLHNVAALQKKAPNVLKSLARAQNRTPLRAVRAGLPLPPCQTPPVAAKLASTALKSRAAIPE